MADLEIQIGIDSTAAKDQIDRFVKESVTKLEEINRRAQEAGRTSVGGRETSAIKELARMEQILAKERLTTIKLIEKAKLDGVRMAKAAMTDQIRFDAAIAREQRQIAKATADAKIAEIRRAQAAEKASSPYAVLRISSQAETTSRINSLKTALEGVRREYIAGDASAEKLAQAQRAYNKEVDKAYGLTSRLTRSPLHRFLAQTASLTFELTGAFYGMASALAIVTGPAAFGVKLLKNMEDMKFATAAILTNMTEIGGRTLTIDQSMGAASVLMKQLAADAIKFALPIEAVQDTFRSILASGTAAGLTLSQVRQIATLGTIAVRTIGLDSKQAVQETRDLVAGGIQAASSTLASALGITDSMVKAWKEAGTLATNLEARMGGFLILASERTNTLGGAWDTLITKLQYAFANERIFEGLKNAIKSVSDSIATVDEGNLTFKPEFIAGVKQYTDALLALGGIIVKIGGFIKDHIEQIKFLAEVYASLKVASIAGRLLDGLGITLLRVGNNAKVTSTGLGEVKASIENAANSSAIGKAEKLGGLSEGGLIGFMLFGKLGAAAYTAYALGALDNLIGNLENSYGNLIDRIRKKATPPEVAASRDLAIMQRRIDLLQSRPTNPAEQKELAELLSKQRELSVTANLSKAVAPYLEESKKLQAEQKLTEYTMRPQANVAERMKLFSNTETSRIEALRKSLEEEKKLLSEAEKNRNRDEKFNADYLEAKKRVALAEQYVNDEIARIQNKGAKVAGPRAPKIAPDVTAATNAIQNLEGKVKELKAGIQDLEGGAVKPLSHSYENLQAQLAAGEWKNATQQQKEYALSLAKTVDELENQKQALEANKAAMNAADAVIENLRASTERYAEAVEGRSRQRTIDLLTAGRPAIERDMITAQQEYQNEVLQLTKMKNKGLMRATIENSPEQIARINEEYKKQIEELKTSLDAERKSIEDYYATINSLEYQVTIASYNIREGLTSAFSQAYSDIFTQSQSFGDAMIGLFKNVADMIINEIGRIMAQQFIQVLFGTGTSAAGGALGGGIIGSLFNLALGGFSAGSTVATAAASGVSNSFWTASAGSLFSGARASGGPVYPGGAYLVGERAPELFIPRTAGTIVPSLGGTNIQIIDQRSGNSPPIETSSTTGPNGEQQISILVRREMDRYMTSGYSDKIHNVNYGLRRPGIAR